MHIEVLQSLGIGKFGKGSIFQIVGEKGAGTDAEQSSAERRVGIAIFLEGRKCGSRFDLRFTKPIGVVGAESVAVRVAEERGAIINFARDFVLRPQCLKLGDLHKPATESFLVGRRIEAEEVRSAISEAVVGAWERLVVAGLVSGRIRSVR